MFNGDTPISTHLHSDFSFSSEVATTQQTDSAAHKLKPRLFHKSAHLWVHSVDFHPGVNHAWQSFSVSLSYPSKISWNYCKKSNCDEINKLWKMTFQASDGRGNHFLDLLDDDLNAIEPHQVKGGPWLQFFGHSNSLCARAMRAITNHASIGEYRLWFFPSMNFSCPCNNYPIESRRHILHEYERFNGYWKPRRDTLKHFVIFLTANPNAFAFNDN